MRITGVRDGSSVSLKALEDLCSWTDLGCH